MKKLILPLLLCLLLLSACSETKITDKYDNWQTRNEAFMDSLYQVYTTQTDHGGLDTLHLLSAPGKFILYKKLTPVTSLQGYQATDERPIDQSTTVDVYYKGVDILGERIDGYYGDAPTIYDDPVNFKVLYGSIINGWWEALQRMPLGSRWKVYIPWQYAYGASGTTSVLGYSTLIFDIQLFRINKIK